MGNSEGGFKEYWDIIRKYPKYQADLSGIILTSQSTKRTDTASGSSHMAEISATGLQMEISAETASVMAERERLLQRCRR